MIVEKWGIDCGKNCKIIRSNDVIFDETCMYKEPVEPQGPTRIIIDDDGHLGQLPRVGNQPEQVGMINKK